MIKHFFTTIAIVAVTALHAQEARVQETEKPSIGPRLMVENYSGPVTPNEIAAFKAHIAHVQPPPTADRNVYVYGNPGKIIEACGLMYEVTSDREILDRMIFYSDAALAGRNDLASQEAHGQRIVWTGKVEPVWPSSQPDVSPAGAGIEQGSVLAHILYTAKLILQNPSLGEQKITANNTNNTGTTYKEKAITYIQQADLVIDSWIMPHFVRRDKRFYFPGSPNTYKPNDPAPWNQLFMLTNGFIRLSQCHELLKDAPEKIKAYDEIVKVNIKWFKDNVKAFRSATGSTCWKFDYALGSRMEDTNHFAYDSEGMWLAWDAGKYGVTKDDMMAMANTYFDVVLATTMNGRFAGNVDGSTGTGHAGGDNYVRDEYIYLADIRKDKFLQVCTIEHLSNKIPTSPQITARLLWLKDRRNKENL
ncbi:MAG: hypothetical protein QM731_07400 [Chitinophagaceae bacterium]